MMQHFVYKTRDNILTLLSCKYQHSAKSYTCNLIFFLQQNFSFVRREPRFGRARFCNTRTKREEKIREQSTRKPRANKSLIIILCTVIPTRYDAIIFPFRQVFLLSPKRYSPDVHIDVDICHWRVTTDLIITVKLYDQRSLLRHF